MRSVEFKYNYRVQYFCGISAIQIYRIDWFSPILILDNQNFKAKFDCLDVFF